MVEISEKRRTIIFMNMLIACIASSLLATALTTALPQMIEEFNVSVTTGQWLTSGYSLAMGTMMPLTAFLIKRFPTKKLYLTAIAAFILGLLLSVAAPNFEIMMVGRIVQACGNGTISSMTQVVLLTIYPPEKRGSIMGLYGLSIGAAPVIAPTLGGILVDISGWRMIFYIPIAIMALSLAMAIKSFDDVLDTSKNKFDVISFALSVFAFGGITLGIGNVSDYGFMGLQTLLPLAIGFVTAVFFVYRQFKLSQPFLELRVLKSKEYTFGLIGSMLLYFVMMGSSFILPLYIQTIMGYSATISGLITLPGSLAMAIVSPFAGRLYDKFGMKRLFIFGSIFMLLSNVGMIFITKETSILVAGFYNLIRNVSIGCLMMPFVTWGVSGVKSGQTADATALLTSLRTIAGAIGTAAFVGIMTAVSENAASIHIMNADIYGLNVTFFAMSISTVALLVLAFFSGERRRHTKAEI